MTASSPQSQLPGSHIGGLAIVASTSNVLAHQVTFLQSVAHQYVDRFSADPLTLSYAPASSNNIQSQHITAQPGLRIDSYRAPATDHPHAGSFTTWAKRAAAQADREGFGVLLIPSNFSQSPPGLIVTDVDSTLIAQEVIEEIAHFAGTRDQVKAITDRAMNGEIDFAQSLRERVSTLRGVSLSVFHDVAQHVEIHAGAKELIDAVHRFGGYFGVVSGGFEEVVAPLVEHLGIDHMAANRLETTAGVLTGRVLGDIVTAQTKVERLTQWAELHDVPLERCVAVGDGANDIPMLHEAGLGVAFCAKSAVRQAVASCLTLPRLDTLTCLF